MKEFNVLMPREDMKFPNGYGTVRKQSGRCRYPYAFYVPEGKQATKDGKLKTKYRHIGNVMTREEGIILLNRYHNTNKDCHNIQLATFEDVFYMWYKERFGDNPEVVKNDYIAAFKLCHEIHKRIFLFLKTSDLQKVIDSSDKNYPTLRKLATLFRQIYRYAISNDLCDKDYSAYINIKKYKSGNPKSRKHHIFSDDDIQIFWANSENNGSIQGGLKSKMKVHIENYKNIGNLDLSIEDNKLNFLYGICGSGKSSLVGALTKECRPEDVSVGKNEEDVVISVDGVNPNPDSYQLFDEQTVANVIIMIRNHWGLLKQK